MISSVCYAMIIYDVYFIQSVFNLFSIICMCLFYLLELYHMLLLDALIAYNFVIVNVFTFYLWYVLLFLLVLLFLSILVCVPCCSELSCVVCGFIWFVIINNTVLFAFVLLCLVEKCVIMFILSGLLI